MDQFGIDRPTAPVWLDNIEVVAEVMREIEISRWQCSSHKGCTRSIDTKGCGGCMHSMSWPARATSIGRDGLTRRSAAWPCRQHGENEDARVTY